MQLQDALAEVPSLGNQGPSAVAIGAGPSWLRRMLPEAVTAGLQESSPGRRALLTPVRSD